jgi:hypothetical protein
MNTHRARTLPFKSPVLGFLFLIASSASSADFQPGWKIDIPMKFSLAYLAPLAPWSDSAPAAQALLKGSKHAPDITNIGYDALLSLGFPLAPLEKPENRRFLIKLYRFPDRLNAKQSSHRALEPFHLHLVPGADEIIRFAEKAGNLAVKYSVIDEKNHGPYTAEAPLWPFILPDNRVAAQVLFDSHIPFTSIYLNPSKRKRSGSLAQRAEESAGGVVIA